MSKCRLRPIRLEPSIRARWMLPCIYNSDQIAARAHSGLPMPEGWPELPTYDLPSEFDRRGMRPASRMVLELCCGLGDFLCRMASQNPDARHVGVDYARPVAERAARLLGENHMENALVYFGRLEDFFDHDCRSARFDLIMVNFPDPWPKTRHVKRRVVSAALIPRVSKALLPGGLLITATDVRPLHEHHVAVLKGAADLEWTNPEDRNTPPLPVYQNESHYEKKGRADGRTVHYTVHRRRG